VIEMNWWDQAACRTEPPELFFPVGTTGPARRQIAEAKSVCHRCPVTAACLAWALNTGQRHGVWGGLSEDERHELQRRSARISAPAHLILIPAPQKDPTEVVRHP
jgi:WhiB family redox-sensing transcriptional regulator